MRKKNAVRVGLSLKPDTLKSLDRMAHDIGKSRSGMIEFFVDGMSALSENQKWTEMVEAMVESTVRKLTKK